MTDGQIDPSAGAQAGRRSPPPRRPTRRRRSSARRSTRRKVDPDIYFFGFDLTVAEARGGTGEDPDDDPGLVLRHQGAPGRAALRLRRRAARGRSRPSNDLAWDDALPGRRARRASCRRPRLSTITLDALQRGRRREARPARGRPEGRRPRRPAPRAGLHPLPGAGDRRRPRGRDAAAARLAMADFDAARPRPQRRRARSSRLRASAWPWPRAALRQARGRRAASSAARAAVREADAARARRARAGWARRSRASRRSPTRARRSASSTTLSRCLLFPVRLETRFKRQASCGCGSTPTTARSTPSRRPWPRSRSATRAAYWQGIWRAGGIEADERAAWRGLVASHGSGRAGVDRRAPISRPTSPTSR